MAHQMKTESLAECLAEALMIEREAADRCNEFAEFLEDHDEHATAALFRKLARFEQLHAEELERRAIGVPLPPLRQWEFSWLYDAPPDQGTREIIFHLLTPYDALKIALGAERRARDLFDQVARATSDPAVRGLAEELAAEEVTHIGWLEDSLAKAPRPLVTEADFEPLFRR